MLRQSVTLCLFAALTLAAPVWAETLVAARTIRAQTVLVASDILQTDASFPGAARKADDVVGLEARVAIYQGRPILSADLGPPTLVDRNQIVTLSYRSGALVISTEGRALGRGSAGDHIRVMNIASRSTVTGTVAPDGSVLVSQSR